jgi:hypothetical protein
LNGPERAAEGGGGADRARPEPVADAVHGLFGDQAVLAGMIEADLLGDLVGSHEVLALSDVS